MNANQKIALSALVYFAFLIGFETAQQHYYINRFELAGQNEVSYFQLFQNHLLRWVVWGLFSIPFARYVRQNPMRELTLKGVLNYVLGIGLSLLATLLVISLLNLQADQSPLSSFGDYFLFFVFQKAGFFVSASLGLAVLLHLQQNLRLLDAKVVELSDLKTRYQTLYQNFKERQQEDDTPLIQIKIGNKVKNILLSEVIWVQADDYCVKVHTADKAYHLRKSMKAMEKELSARGFIRVHRKSIVNKAQIDTLKFAQDPHVVLKNGWSIPMAASRVSEIRAKLKA